MGQHELGQARRPEQVDLELVAGPVEGDVLGGAVEPEPGVVDQDVDPALAVEDGPHGPLQVGGNKEQLFETVVGQALGELADAYRAKLEAIGHAQRAGHLSSALDPVDLLILVLALASAWFAASPPCTASPPRTRPHPSGSPTTAPRSPPPSAPSPPRQSPRQPPDGRRDHGRCRAHQEARDQAWPAWVVAPRKRRRGASGYSGRCRWYYRAR